MIESLLIDALGRAEASDDALAEAHVAHQYGMYLGIHGQFEKSLAHVARAVDLLGARGEHLQQAITMALGGRCYCARAGRLEEALFTHAARMRPEMRWITRSCERSAPWKLNPICTRETGTQRSRLPREHCRRPGKYENGTWLGVRQLGWP